MTDATPPPPRPLGPTATGLADGEWHRLHPATPLLRGGIFVLAILGFAIANLRERLVEIFFGGFAPDFPDGYDGNGSEWSNDPVDRIVASGTLGWVILAVAGVLVLLLVGFWLSWRMHTFRVTGESVEVRSGIVFRSHRSARLDRIQGINISRPLLPRILGAARLEVAVAGQSANVQLAYLAGKLADGLRADILRLASGTRAAPRAAPDDAQPAFADYPPPTGAPVLDRDAPAPGGPGAQGAFSAAEFARERVGEFLSPELDPSLATPESVVHIPPGRVIGSTLLSGASIALLLVIGGFVWGLSTGRGWVFFAFIPAVIGFGSYYWSRVTKSLRFSIAGTPDGVRVGHGLLSTSNDTIPPGRIHAIQVQQSIIWRPFGWWMIRITTAGQSIAEAASSQSRSIVLPVGTRADVTKVLSLILPSADLERLSTIVDRGMFSRGGDELYSATPRRAAWLKPFSWRRTGYAIADGVLFLRRGVVQRDLILVSLARVQSMAVHQGPVRRALRLVNVRVHTVAGPVIATLPVIDSIEARRFFDSVTSGAVEWALRDTSNAWGVDAPGGLAALADSFVPGEPTVSAAPLEGGQPVGSTAPAEAAPPDEAPSHDPVPPIGAVPSVDPVPPVHPTSPHDSEAPDGR